MFSFVFFSFLGVLFSFCILVIFDFACGTSTSSASCRLVYIVYLLATCVCVCVSVWEIWHMSCHDGCCLPRTQSCFHVLLAVSSRRAQQHKSTYFIGIYVLLWRRPALWRHMPHYVQPLPASLPSTPWQLPPPGWPPSGQSRVVFLFFFCLPRILLHFYSCWRACFAAIASFTAMSWPCCMWHAACGMPACLPASGVRQLRARCALKCTLCI